MQRAATFLPWLGAVACGASASGLPHASPQPQVTFTRDIAPIIFDRCSICHRPGEAAPFSLLTFEDARRRARQIAEVTQARYMPPWLPEDGCGEFAAERRLTDAQIALIQQWADSGAPQGDAAHLPRVPDFPSGWQLGEPDLVIHAPEPYTLRADGPDDFRNLVVPVALDEARYIRAFEFRPGNPRVVHHAIVYADRTSSSRRRDALEPGPGFGGMDVGEAINPDGHFLGWTPGNVPDPGHESIAWKLEPGTDLVVQLHLQPSGKVETVQPAIGLHFADRPPTRQLFHVSLHNEFIDIPAGSTDYAVEAEYTLPVDVEVLSIYPHAHYLAKTMRVDAALPDGGNLCLLRIDDWDFNWQDRYVYARPVALPRGARLSMRYAYDNSAANPRNPHSPPRQVIYGLQSTDEMATCGIQVLPRNAADLETLRADKTRADLLARVEQYQKIVARFPDEPRAHDVLGVALRKLGRFDDAIHHERRAVALDSTAAMFHANLGQALYESGSFNEAAAAFAEAARLDAQLVEAQRGLALSLFELKRDAQAIEHYQIALRLEPEHGQTHYNYGLALQRANRLDDAIKHFREAARWRPDHAKTHYSLGLCLALQNQIEPAREQFQRAVDLDPEYAEAHNNLGVSLEMLGQRDGARRHFREALRIRPDFADAQRNLQRLESQSR